MQQKILRQNAIEWWNQLSIRRQVELWFEYRKEHFTPSRGPSEMTGREVEMLFTKHG